MMEGQLPIKILCIAGPTASGKSSRAVEIALRGFVNPSSDDGFTKPLMGEIISVDSRQVYRGLDIGTEKITAEEMCGVPHHLIDIREPKENYSAGDFVQDATRLIAEISARGKLPILVGGTHFYFDALLNGLPMGTDANPALREELEKLSTEELYARVRSADARRAEELDPQNRRRLVRALEIIAALGSVPPRSEIGKVKLSQKLGKFNFPNFRHQVKRFNLPTFEVEWIVIDPPREELRARIDARLQSALDRGLVDEVRRVRDAVGDIRLNELGLEYRIIGEFLRSEANLAVSPPSELGGETAKLLLATLSAKLWQYARRQKAWLRKLGHPVS